MSAPEGGEVYRDLSRQHQLEPAGFLTPGTGAPMPRSRPNPFAAVVAFIALVGAAAVVLGFLALLAAAMAR